jgi:hypothetical protein
MFSVNAVSADIYGELFDGTYIQTTGNKIITPDFKGRNAVTVELKNVNAKRSDEVRVRCFGPDYKIPEVSLKYIVSKNDRREVEVYRLSQMLVSESGDYKKNYVIIITITVTISYHLM